MTTLHEALPLRLTGHLDPRVGRWQWLFKWLLAIPHWIVLLFLWIGFAGTYPPFRLDPGSAEPPAATDPRTLAPAPTPTANEVA